jgi:hypothetical protein
MLHKRFSTTAVRTSIEGQKVPLEMKKPHIAHFSGPNATIQNSPPLVTSNKARSKYGLPLVTAPDGELLRFDVLRPQKLAAPVTVYVEQFSAHPLESDAAELYAPPDGFLDSKGAFRKERTSPNDKPVYEIKLDPDDGLFPLPYMARQADGSAWDEECAAPGAPAERARQAFYPDGSRSFEEIDRLGIGGNGWGNLISSKAVIDFYRVMPPAGYTKGLAAGDRTDVGEGDIDPERRGSDFFPYRPRHLSASPPRSGLAHVVNRIRGVLASDRYTGAIWTQGSPHIEETIYWLNLLLDTTLPICGTGAQRSHGQLSDDGPKNIVDCIEYITSRIWADGQGRNRAGMVLIQEQQIFAARDVQKGDARPGGYVATGGHGGILGGVGFEGPPILTYIPATKHTYLSEVNIARLSQRVMGVGRENGRLGPVEVLVKNESGDLSESAIPRVSILKESNYTADSFEPDPRREVDILAHIEYNLDHAPLAGFVIEGTSPYGEITSAARQQLMRKAVHCGMPVVRVGRGNNEGFSPARDRFIAGRNLTATKARLLLIAALMKLGSLPPTHDPENPTESELAAMRERLNSYQQIFDTH